MLKGKNINWPNYRHIILIATLWIGPIDMLPAQNYHIANFNNEEDLPQPYIYTINQDNRGYLWIGTGNGLSRYDGYEFRTYTQADSLADNFISCSFKTEKGIWFGHMNGDLTYFDENRFEKKIINSKAKTMITDIEKGYNNEILASSYSNGIIIIKNSNAIITTNPFNSDLPASIICIMALNKDELLVGAIDGLFVYAYDKSASLRLKQKITEIPDTKISDLIKVPHEEAYLIATQNKGIYRLQKVKDGFRLINW